MGVRRPNGVSGLLCIVCILAFLNEVVSDEDDISPNYIAVTVATNETEGYQRFMRSAKVYKIPIKVLGLGKKWEGGNVKMYAGGGQKINLLKNELEKYKDDSSKIVIFTDSYDVIYLGAMDRIVEQFLTTDAKVLFSAEGFCWPDESLASKYPTVQRGKRYLNSGGFIGYAPELYGILTSSEVQNDDDDQLFYTKVYLNEGLRQKYKIKLDHKSEIFQNLNGAIADVELRFKGKDSYLQNTAYNTVPLILHGNGPSKIILNTLGNYLANSWSPEDGCVACWEDMISLDKLEEQRYPRVLVAVFIEHPTPFMEEFWKKIDGLIYPKDKIDLFIHNAAEYHGADVDSFLEQNEKLYNSVKKIIPSDNVKEWHARNLAIDECDKKECDYLFSLDGEAHLDNPHTLKLLIEQNRGVVAPLLIRPYKSWSNFWGALTSDGFYARSMDYMEIINNQRRGLWNVPYINGAYLINGTIIRHPELRPSYINNLMDPDMAFCQNIREKDLFLYVNNRVDFGHLVNSENFETNHLHNDLYQIFENRWDWEQRYIHENYTHNLDPNRTVEQPCQDVFWFPVVKERYCDELVAEMENFGKWSDGSNSDPRLDGGYENVPTRDVHMKQVGMEPQWMEFLRLYIRPLQEHVFSGYFHDPPRALMNFVVRYRPDEQPYLRPHHDSSTYTINLALNVPKVDYEGGGCRFIRYNCSVTDTRKGWLLMHPGRLTHYHEGLPVTKGTRYIMISFVDP